MAAADHRWQHPAHVGRPPHPQLRQVVPPVEYRYQAGVNEPLQVAADLAAHRLFMTICQFPAMRASWLREIVK